MLFPKDVFHVPCLTDRDLEEKFPRFPCLPDQAGEPLLQSAVPSAAWRWHAGSARPGGFHRWGDEGHREEAPRQ